MNVKTRPCENAYRQNNKVNKRIKMQKINLINGACEKLLRKFSSKTSNEWKSVIGLEIHAQIFSESKLFSGSRNNFASEINSSVALLDAAIPGCLPVLNKRCVEAGVKTALAFNCKVNEVSMFDRKHYFYGDLPTGYQITQQRAPLASNGSLNFPVIIASKSVKTYYKTVRLHQLQLEQDSGKSLHDDELGISLIDLNRAGVPLMELVFDPSLSDGEEAASLVKELILILTRLGTCSCRMEEGALRVDANVSIHKKNEPLGVRTEIKNIGSVRGVAKAIEYEIERQKTVKNKGGEIINETRQWDANSKTTIAMRDKEVVQDYRFMPEPNLLPLHLNMSEKPSDEMVNVNEIKSTLPSLPHELRNELINVHNLSEITAVILVNEPFLYTTFQAIRSENPKRTSKIISNILITELLGACNKNKIDVNDCQISPKHIGELVDMLESQEVNLNLARLIINEMLVHKLSPREISDQHNWKQISDDDEIKKICHEVLSTTQGEKMAKQYKAGKLKVLLAIAGEIYRKTDNRINMAKVVDILKEILKQ